MGATAHLFGPGFFAGWERGGEDWYFRSEPGPRFYYSTKLPQKVLTGAGERVYFD